MDYSYLAPPLTATSIVHTDYYIKHNEREKGARKIFETVVYDQFELEKIKELKEEIKKQKIILPHDWKESDYLRMGYAGRFKMKDVLKKLQQFVSWKCNKIYHEISTQIEQFLNSGICYVFGRDKQYRPIVILNAYLIDPKKHDKELIIQALSFMLGVVRKYMFLPGKIETWIFLLESQNQGVMGLPIKMLQTIIDILSTNFTGCLEKMFIINPSTGLNFLWNTIKSFLDDETAEKIDFLQQKQLKKLLDLIDSNQLERKYGGTQPNQEKFWPPYNLDLTDGYTVKQKIEQIQNQEEDDPYDKVEDNLFDFMKQQQQIYYSNSQKQLEDVEYKQDDQIVQAPEPVVQQIVEESEKKEDIKQEPEPQEFKNVEEENQNKESEQQQVIKESSDQVIITDRTKLNVPQILEQKQTHDENQIENNVVEVQQIDPVVSNSSCCRNGCEIF